MTQYSSGSGSSSSGSSIGQSDFKDRGGRGALEEKLKASYNEKNYRARLI